MGKITKSLPWGIWPKPLQWVNPGPNCQGDCNVASYYVLSRDKQADPGSIPLETIIKYLTPTMEGPTNSV